MNKSTRSPVELAELPFKKCPYQNCILTRAEKSAKIPKLLLFALAFPALILSLPAQTADDQTTQDTSVQLLSPEELGDLLGPIALYPDALIALILPASTVPTDITLAARYLAANGNSAPVDGTQWDDSVKALAKYPLVLKWMDQNLEWTESLGDAFVAQPADVMNTIQQLREKARSAGTLVDTPQQKVEVDEGSIEIVPADPEVIYVPFYDPEVVYVEAPSPSYGSVITFSSGCAVGSWLNYDFDWGQRCLYHGSAFAWNNRQRQHGGHYAPAVVNNVVVNNNTTNVYKWQPSDKSRRQFILRQQKNAKNGSVAPANVATQSNGANGGNARPPQGSRPAQVTQVQPGNTQPQNALAQPGSSSSGGQAQRHVIPGELKAAPANFQRPKQSEVHRTEPTRAPAIAAPVEAAPRVIYAPAPREQHVQPQQQHHDAPPQAPREHVQQAHPQQERPSAPAQRSSASSDGGQHSKNSDDGGKKKKKDNN